MNGGFETLVDEVFGCAVGDEKDVAVTDGNVRILTVNHALEIERGEGASAFLIADEDGLGGDGVRGGSPGKRKRLNDGESLCGIDGEAAGANDIADDVDESGAADLHRVAWLQFRIVIGFCVGSGGIEDDVVRRLRRIAMIDADEAASGGSESGCGGDEIEQAMVRGVRIDAGTRNFAEDADILTGGIGDEHDGLRMDEHAVGDERFVDGVGGLRFTESGKRNGADERKRDGAIGDDTNDGVKFRIVKFADVEEITGVDRQRDGHAEDGGGRG